MPFQLIRLKSFERCFKKLGSREKAIAEVIVHALRGYFIRSAPPTGEPYVFEFEGRSYRLTFKKIKDTVWEAYVEGQIRVLTRLEGDSHYLVFAGNHDQVRQFLRKS